MNIFLLVFLTSSTYYLLLDYHSIYDSIIYEILFSCDEFIKVTIAANYPTII